MLYSLNSKGLVFRSLSELRVLLAHRLSIASSVVAVVSCYGIKPIIIQALNLQRPEQEKRLWQFYYVKQLM